MNSKVSGADLDDSDGLGIGVRRLRPDDHFMVLAETDASPMHIGALLLLDVPDEERSGFFDQVRRSLMERLESTPLLVGLHQAPDGYDSDVWVDVESCEEGYHFERVDAPLDNEDLYRFLGQRAVERLDLDHPPFRVFVFDNLVERGAAIYLKVHHSLTDGVGFQSLLRVLGDETGSTSTTRVPGKVPDDVAWMAAAEARFAETEELRESRRLMRRDALAVLRSGTLPERATTPVLALSGPTSLLRGYTTLSFDVDRFHAAARGLDATINDLFLGVWGSAVRSYLFGIDDLPEEPIVVNASRSYRREEEHGLFGNRIVAIHPHLATHLADPIERLRAIQTSMEAERARTGYDESLLDALEEPFGARDRRAKFAARTQTGAAVLPGNVTLSNVPGPSEPRSIAGYRQLANYPVPILGSARFLNCTMRRNGDHLDLGIMVDAAKIPDASYFPDALVDAVAEYEALAQPS